MMKVSHTTIMMAALALSAIALTSAQAQTQTAGETCYRLGDRLVTIVPGPGPDIVCQPDYVLESALAGIRAADGSFILEVRLNSPKYWEFEPLLSEVGSGEEPASDFSAGSGRIVSVTNLRGRAGGPTAGYVQLLRIKIADMTSGGSVMIPGHFIKLSRTDKEKIVFSAPPPVATAAVAYSPFGTGMCNIPPRTMAAMSIRCTYRVISYTKLAENDPNLLKMALNHPSNDAKNTVSANNAASLRNALNARNGARIMSGPARIGPVTIYSGMNRTTPDG